LKYSENYNVLANEQKNEGSFSDACNLQFMHRSLEQMRIMKRLLIILLVAITGSAYAQKTETRNVAAFSGVKAQAGVDVYLKKGSKESVRVVVTGNIEPANVVTEVSGGTLKISVDHGGYNNVDVKVYVTYVDIDKLMVHSAATIFSENIIKTSKLTLTATSSGTIDIQAEVHQLEASAGSAGEIELKGKAETAIMEAASAGEIDAYEMVVNTVKVKAATAGSAKVNVVKEIEAKAVTGADIRFRGNPERSNTSSSTGGSVKKSN
jgi:hypothetical protein